MKCDSCERCATVGYYGIRWKKASSCKKSQTKGEFLREISDEKEKRMISCSATAPGRGFEDISEDGIICSILAGMPMRDAVRTSVLSRRWKDVWKHIPHLRFDSATMLPSDPVVDESWSRLEYHDFQLLCKPRADKFVNAVNDFLIQHRAVGVKSFMVGFRLRIEHAQHLDRWIDFAVDSGARALVLGLMERHMRLRPIEELYDFPCHLLDGARSSNLKILFIAFCNLRLPPSYAGFSSLRRLDLTFVPNIGTRIRDILAACPKLEWITIVACDDLVRLEISQPYGGLRRFDVRGCSKLEEIIFDGVSFDRFQLKGDRWPIFTLKNAPQIRELWLQIFDSGETKMHYIAGLCSSFPKMEILTLYTSGPIEVPIFPETCTFTHLKCIRMFPKILLPKDDFVGIAYLISAAPFLETLELHILDYCWREYYPGNVPWCNGHIHKHLKLLTIGGFHGTTAEIEFVLHVVQTAIVLESLIIHPYYRVYDSPSGWSEKKFSPSAPPPELSREKAYEYFNGNIRDGVKLSVL